jgi:hypothetical protein
MHPKRFLPLLAGLPLILAAACASRQPLTEGPFTADGQCPTTFKPLYPRCDITFGSKGLSTLNSFYETFVGEGAFVI